MGLDLTLLPHDVGNSQDWAAAHSMLLCRSCSALNDAVLAIEAVRGVRVPAYFATFRARGAGGDPAYGNTQETPYGEPLRSVTVAELVRLAEHEAVQDNPINRAIWAYLGQLPPDMRVALFWH